MKYIIVLLLAVSAVLAAPVEEKQALWERSGKFEGDIVLTPEQERSLARNGLINTKYRWKNRTIPYKFASGLSSAFQDVVRTALEEFKKTCVTVREATSSDKDYVLVKSKNDGCYSHVGRLGRSQTLNLQNNTAGSCLSTGIIVHEFLHAAGFYHQQSATDRDKYVKIKWNNIKLGQRRNFKKYRSWTVTDFGVDYDYGSVMHYGPYAFSWNGRKTIVTKDASATIGQREGFSATDIEKLNRMYGC